jgi:hypothetical protein
MRYYVHSSILSELHNITQSQLYARDLDSFALTTVIVTQIISSIFLAIIMPLVTLVVNPIGISNPQCPQNKIDPAFVVVWKRSHPRSDHSLYNGHFTLHYIFSGNSVHVQQSTAPPRRQRMVYSECNAIRLQVIVVELENRRELERLAHRLVRLEDSFCNCVDFTLVP